MNMTVSLESSDRLVELLDGPWYEWDEKVAALVVSHEPSARDMTVRFATTLQGLVPGVECIGGQRGARYLIVDNVNYKRRHQYMLLRIPHEDLVAHPADIVRGAYFAAMDRFAGLVAEQVAIERAESPAPWSIRWLGAAPASCVGSTEGQHRIAIDNNRDGIVVLLASYYYVCPMEARR